MSGYNDQGPIKLAEAAEKDLNSYQAKQGLSNQSDSGKTSISFFSRCLLSRLINITLTHQPLTANESGVNQAVENKFPGASVKYGSEASGAGDNRTIPEDEGGDILPSGRPTKARDFEGVGGPENKAELDRQDREGDDDISGNVRQ